jgi:hypothetical protein
MYFGSMDSCFGSMGMNLPGLDYAALVADLLFAFKTSILEWIWNDEMYR